MQPEPQGLIAQIEAGVRIVRGAATIGDALAGLASLLAPRYRLWRASAGLVRGESYDILAMWSPTGTIFEPGDVITVDPSEESRLMLDVVIRGRVTVTRTEELANPVLRDAFRSEGVSIFVIVPIRDAAGDVVGALTFDSADEDAFSGGSEVFEVLRRATEPDLLRLLQKRGR